MEENLLNDDYEQTSSEAISKQPQYPLSPVPDLRLKQLTEILLRIPAIQSPEPHP